MNLEPDKESQEIEYSSFSAFESIQPSTITTTSNIITGTHQTSALTPSSYIIRNTPRTFPSIEQFDFKAFPEQTNNNQSKNATDTLPSSSGLTTMSTSTNDTSAGLVQQSQQEENLMYKPDTNDNKNNDSFAMTSFVPTSVADTSDTDANDMNNHDQLQQQQQQQQEGEEERQQLQNRHTELIDSKVDIKQQQQQQQQNRKQQRNYQVFPGNSKFFCGGRFMTSKAYWAFIIAMILVIAPSVLFSIFTCPFLWSNIHPVVPILYAYLFVIAMVSMLKTSWTDPGVIPRGLDPTPTLETFDDHSSIWTQPFPADRCVKIKDEMWNLKYCSTCKIYRPPRASHCRQCDNCVENEDHHCIWLNNCIGKRNYRPFFTFIMTCTLMAIYLIVFCVLHIFLAARQIQPDINFDLVFTTTPVSFILAIIGFFLLWMVGGLTLYHCHLVWKGLSTHEKLRSNVYDTQTHAHANPYGKKNPFVNIFQVLCRPQPKSHIRRRKFVESP